MSETQASAVPSVGDSVPISFFDAQHTVHSAIAHVLSVGPRDSITGLPSLTLAYPDPSASARVLASAQWYNGYIRSTGVLPVSDARVQYGEVSVAWGGSVATSDAAAIPKPEGDAVNSVFTRAEDPLPVQVSVLQTVQNNAAEATTASTTAETTDSSTSTTTTAAEASTTSTTAS